MNIREGLAKELHKQSRINYPRRFVEVKGIDDLYQADLVDMSAFSRINKGFKYILTIINCFSKFAIAIPIKTKSAVEIQKSLANVLKKYPMKHFQTDQGTEFFNSKVSSLLKHYGVNQYYTFSEMKASIIERFNRTLKGNMWKKFTEQGTFKWLHILPLLLKNYNNSIHRTIGVRPKDVTKENELDILRKIARDRKKVIVKQRFHVGDKVRISRIQKEFTKGYWPRWSNELYTVYKVQNTSPITYILKDERNSLLKGGFYQQELSKTKYIDTYLVEKVVKRKGDKLLVRWLGFDKSHDSWIDKKDLR